MKYFLFLSCFFITHIAVLGQLAVPHNNKEYENKKNIEWLKKQKTAFETFQKAQGLRVAKQAAQSNTSRIFRTFTCTNSSFNCESPLPVNDLKFEAKRTSADNVLLNWQATTNNQNQGFEVQRRLTSEADFRAIDFINKKGTGWFKYELNDPNASTDVSYYRLKQTDLDGRFIYSKVVVVAGSADKVGVKIFPNPASSSNCNIEFSGFRSAETISLRIVDSKGRVVYQKDKLWVTTNTIFKLHDKMLFTPGTYNATVYRTTGLINCSFVIN